MVNRFLLLVVITLWHVTSYSASFGGQWEVVYPCKGAIGIYKERCDLGVRDHFSLELWTSGGKICGVHEATAQLGNKVDGPEAEPLTGTIDSSSAKVVFHSAFGAAGTALLLLEGSKLRWKILSLEDSTGSSLLPTEAVLEKSFVHPGKTLPQSCRF